MDEFVRWKGILGVFFFFKQKTAYEMRISDWSSDVCSSDLALTTKRLSSRHSLPGPIGVGMATPYYACVRCAARALGPGGKPRDDRGGLARAAGAPLNVQRRDAAGVFLDDGDTQLRLATHELLAQRRRPFILCAGLLATRPGYCAPQQRAP